ncbi:DUF2970 domain-containing protein [Alloalcanivorax profundimaris]|uniref:DUF2970 domain-containing protein n=1 Tax=Alloalcanivorax profundimaris TaxID=2735259 RepID=A0ABS0AQH6_9GAMM|nr:DUF2970 domain-containing protein [Alloalcanivorax profundimaris]MBF1802672.1 DUF2970 domain-containing protein [Alloalcanivorax profundimaris]MBF5056383.1 hypothetical protein [Alloalcanivorax profundimaris]MCQ6262146.1 DUF2970 domain-containing protein [Alcanivorax sp. MM125-6]
MAGNSSNDDSQSAPQERKKASLLDVCQGVLAGLFGVQSQKKRERDFQSGRGSDYLLIYALMVVGLVIGVMAVVAMVVP